MNLYELDNSKSPRKKIAEISDKVMHDYRRQAHYAIQGHKFGSKKDDPNAAAIIAKREKGMAQAGNKIVARRDAQMAQRREAENQRLRDKYAGVDIDAEMAKLKPAMDRAYHEYQYGARNTWSQGRDDYQSLSGKMAELQRAKAALGEGVAEGSLNEFAPPGSNDGDDGFSEETLKMLAAQWYNGNEDPRIEKALMAAGWEIGQDEGYDDEPGVFVVRAGDINGNSYLSWPAHELKQGMAEGEEMATFSALKDWRVWDVHVFNNYYRGKYADYGPRLYSVVASSPEEAREVVINNADYVLQDLLSRKLQNGKKVLPRGSALPIEDKRVGKAQPGTITTMGLKKMLSPDGVQSFKFTNGKIVDGAHMQGGEEVAEGEGMSEEYHPNNPSYEIQSQGQQAALAGQPNNNPYGDPDDSKEAYFWQEGYEIGLQLLQIRKQRQGVTEATGNVGRDILDLIRNIKHLGDDAMEELYSSCPLLAQFWDQYEGDFRSMVVELSPKTLQRIYAEITAVVQGEGLDEGKYKCSCHPGDSDPDCPVHGLEPMDVGDALDVKEGVADALPMSDAVKVLKQYGGEHFKTGSESLNFYKGGKPYKLELTWNDDTTRSVSLHELNHVVRTLKAQDNKFNFNPDDNWSQDFETRMSKGVAEGNDGFDTHIVMVTVSDPGHQAVTQRGELKQRRCRVRADDRESAVNTAIKWYRKQGYRVHDHHYVGAIRSGATPQTEDTGLNELSNELLGRYKKELGVRASAADKAGDYDKGHELFKKINKATIRQGENDARKHEQENQNEMMETRLNMMRKAGYDL